MDKLQQLDDLRGEALCIIDEVREAAENTGAYSDELRQFIRFVSLEIEELRDILAYMENLEGGDR